MEQKDYALSCMKEWLSHENELGKEPYQIEMAGEFDLHDLHYYIFKFKKSMLSPWQVGVCGGYQGDELGHCGHIFSQYEKYDEKSAQQKCIDMAEMIREYWMNEAKKQEKPEPRTTYVHFVLLENDHIDFQKIFEYLKNHWQIEIEDINENEDAIYVGNVKDSMVSLSLMNVPVPEGEAEYYAQGCYMWEDAVNHVKKHQAHLIVSTMGKNLTDREALLLQSQLIDACLQAPQAIAVYGDEMVWPKHIYTDIMNDYYQNQIYPVAIWVYLGFVTNSDGHHIYTIGLKNFGHYEIETLPSSLPLSQLHEFMFNVVCYIVEQGAILHDGETIGMSETQKCQISLSQGMFLDEQTLKIEIVDDLN